MSNLFLLSNFFKCCLLLVKHQWHRSFARHLSWPIISFSFIEFARIFLSLSFTSRCSKKFQFLCLISYNFQCKCKYITVRNSNNILVFFISYKLHLYNSMMITRIGYKVFTNKYFHTLWQEEYNQKVRTIEILRK